VETPEGTRLTRAGHFGPNQNGDLVTADGYPVLDAGGAPVFVPTGAGPVTIGADGTISAAGQLVGQIGVVVPTDGTTLRREGGTMFAAPDGFNPAENARVLQGFLEASNVNPTLEIARMIEVQRAYELGQSFLDKEDERIRAVMQTIGRPTAVSMILSQGTSAQTGGDLDVAIEGRGYLEVTLPNGAAAYTRDGGLKRTGDGLIVTSDGFPVVPNITIPQDAQSLAINAQGEVYASFNDRVEPELLGQLTLAGFTNPKGLEAIGSNLFIETGASGPSAVSTPGSDGLGTLRQGYLEESSVDPVKEVTDLIEAQRGYELNSKVITAADQMLSATVQIR